MTNVRAVARNILMTPVHVIQRGAIKGAAVGVPMGIFISITSNYLNPMEGALIGSSLGAFAAMDWLRGKITLSEISVAFLITGVVANYCIRQICE